MRVLRAINTMNVLELASHLEDWHEVYDDLGSLDLLRKKHDGLHRLRLKIEDSHVHPKNVDKR